MELTLLRDKKDRGYAMERKIKVWETVETVTVLSSDRTGVYRVVWHRTEGPAEEFDVTPAEGDTVEEAIAKDLKTRMGP
ncbi:MAG: hypothetical protein HKN84_08600 [Gammaproteobacteria bacterium]|nr:hypothetical protein [Gammaproteobacteria bacterium]